MTTTASPLAASLTSVDGIPLPLTSVDLAVAVDGLSHATTVTQVFVNGSTEPIEAIYTFPLAGGAAVSGCTIRIGERVLTAVLKELKEARREYDEALLEGHAAAIVEKQASEIFEIRVGNIEPDASIEVEIVLHGEVHVDDNEATLRIPTLVAPRYVPQGAGDDVVDTRDIPRAPGASSPVRTRITVRNTDTGTVLDCPSHLEQGIGGVLDVTNIALDRDVIVRWSVLPSFTEARWVADPFGDGSTGTIEVIVRVPADPAAERTPKDVVVLLDHSGSMGGWGQSAANATVIDLIASLQPGDTIRVLQFDSTTEALPSCATGPVAVGDPRLRALIDEVRGVEAEGGTELIDALTAGAAALPASAPDRERVLVLITDGQFGDEQAAVRLRNTVLAGVRMIVVGIDMAVSGGFLAELADGSYVELIESDARRAEVSGRICGRLTSPVFSGLLIDEVSDPSRPDGADVYPDRVTRLTGRCPRPTSPITVSDRTGATIGVPVSVSQDQSIRSRWAAQRLIAMERRDAPADEIVALSIEHQVLCQHTAWVVVDREGKPLAGDPIPVVQPIDFPAGWTLQAPAGRMRHFHRSASPGFVANLSAPTLYSMAGPDSFWVDDADGGWSEAVEVLEEILEELCSTKTLTEERVEQVLTLVPLLDRNQRRRVLRLDLPALVGRLTDVSLRRIEKVLGGLVAELGENAHAGVVFNI